MKKILITGANSYIGTSFEKWLEKYPDDYYIETVDMKDDSWRKKDFSDFDVVFHVAGIAHLKETSKNKYLYYQINRDLSIETAMKAKDEGVKQFVFLSSMSVYGVKNGIIDENTKLSPKNCYGKSKLEAENMLNNLRESDFKIAIIRPPMVYGKGCKGNYPKLARLSKILPFFPNYHNIRSMIYIDNLSEFIRIIINECCSGIFMPQNEDYIATSNMVKLIAETNGNIIRLTRLFNPLIKLLLILKVDLVTKIFGNLVYSKSLNPTLYYNTIDFYDSIQLTEDRSVKD